MSKKVDPYSKEAQKNARAGAEFWYGEIWKTVGKCVFCDLKKKFIVYEKEGIVLTANVYPYIDGHLMIIPRKHIIYAKEFTPREWEIVREFMYLGKKLLKKHLKTKSVWTLYREGPMGEESDKTVEHLHIHLIPYINGLIEKHYQPINIIAEELADKLRKDQKWIDEKLKKFERKYK